MSPTSRITLVVPRVEKESVFLFHVIQAAIRAYRNDPPKSDETNAERDDLSRDKSLAA